MILVSHHLLATLPYKFDCCLEFLNCMSKVLCTKVTYCHALVTVDGYWIVNWIYWITVYNYSYSVSQCTPVTTVQ
jgi:hypothetical protein